MPVDALGIPPGTLEALGLFAVRTSAMVLSSTVFTMGAAFTGYKLALIGALSLVLYTAVGEPIASNPDPWLYAAMGLREVLIGLFMGLVVQMVLLSVKVAGQLIGHEMGFAMAGQIDPESGVATPLVTRLYENLFLIGLLAVGGHGWLIQSLALSCERAPVGAIGIDGQMTATLLTLFTQMFGAGISFAAPVMVMLTLVSILIGLLTRAVPYLNILEISFTVRITFGLVGIYFFLPLVEPVMRGLFSQLNEALATGLDALGG